MTYGAFAKHASFRPESFGYQQSKAIFVDYQTAHYKIQYDLEAKSAWVEAEMIFITSEAGYPIFDSVEVPSLVKLNGIEVTSNLTSTPSKETTLRVVDKIVSPGKHKLEIFVPLKALVEFKDGGVKSAFWTSDLSERNFLERYLPASFEYDQVKMSFDVLFLGFRSRQKVFTNGLVNESKVVNKTIYKITYPSYFNSSSVYFHTVPEGSVAETSFSLKSIDGREIPVVIYLPQSIFGNSSRTLETLKNSTTSIFHELEGDYGAWPHSSLIIYNAGAGGMEYCGATMTSTSALGHELFHSYFARGVMPANGNAGWLDEALASWRDGGYKTLSILSGSSRMSAHPYYTRTTDRAAYSFGERFMSYLDGKLKSQGGLKPFMRFLVDTKIFKPMVIEEFIGLMSAFYGTSMDAEFKKFTYGEKDMDFKHFDSHPVHHKMTLEELKNYL